MGAVAGHKVVVELTEFGGNGKKPEGRVVEILGHINDPGTDILAIAKDFELPMEFPEKVLNQAVRVGKPVSEADNWQLRHMDKVLDLPFRDDVAKPNRDNAIDVYIGDTPEDVIGDGVWAETFTVQPAPLTAEEKKAWLSKVTNVALGSDPFFPFGDNIERARRSGVTAIVQPGGSIRDQQVIDTCNKYGIAMAFCGLRLFHH